MSNINSRILAEIEWDEGLSMPVANVENKQLEHEIQKKQTLIVANQNEFAETDERISAMGEHLRNVRQELQCTQGLVNAREKESQTEDHLLKLAQREEGRLKQEVSHLMKEMDELKEKKNAFENNIFKQTQKLEELKAQMKWDQQTLEAWLEESTRKDEDAMTIQKYTRHDEVKIKELTCRMEKLMAEVMKKKHQLHVDMTTTTTSQIELDKTADDFRHAHNEREELLSQWENTIEQMQKRDREMDLLAAKLATARQEIQNQKAIAQEKLQFLEHELDNNTEQEKKISAAERLNSQMRMDCLQAEQQKSQFESETNTLKRCIDRTVLELELARAAITHFKKEITERSAKLELAKAQRGILVEKLKAAVDSTLNAGEKATKMEDLLMSEEKKQEDLKLQLKRLGDYSYKRDRELTEAKTYEKRAEADINGAHNTIKNLISKIHSLDNDALKQQEILYSQDFTLQQLERRCMRMQGEHNTEEKSNLERTIMNLQKNLDNKTQTNSFLVLQMKKVQDDTRHLTQNLDKTMKEKSEHKLKIEEITLFNDISEAELKRIIQKKQYTMVEENLLKLKIKKLQEFLNSKADDVLSMEKRKLQLNTAMKERHLEIKVHKEMLIAQVKTTDDERQQISAELHERIAKIEKMKKRYEILTVSMAPPEGEEERSQAYYVIKAAQEKEELQREGDNLDARIRKAEKEIRALENTLKLMNGRNEQYRKSFNKITETSDEMDEKHELDEQFRAVMDKYKYKRRQLQELQDDLHTMSTTLDNLSKDEDAYVAVVEDKKNKIMQLSKDTEDQRDKLERVANQNVRLSRSLRGDRKVKAELHEEKDFRVRELRDFLKDQIKIVGDATVHVPEMSEVVQLYFTQANLPLPSSRSGLAGSGSFPGSCRGSTASSGKTSSRASAINLAILGTFSSSASSYRSGKSS